MEKTLADRVMEALRDGHHVSVDWIHRKIGSQYQRSSVFSACFDLAKMGFLIAGRRANRGHGQIRMYWINPKKPYRSTRKVEYQDGLCEAMGVPRNGHRHNGARLVRPAPAVVDMVIEEAIRRNGRVLLVVDKDGQYHAYALSTDNARAAERGMRGIVIGTYDKNSNTHQMFLDILAARE